MTIQLPDDVRALAERQAQAAGFATVGEYLADLVLEDVEVEELPPFPVAISTVEQLRAAIAAGEASPPIPSVEAFFAELRQMVSEGKG